MKIFETLLASIKATVMSLWTKVKLWLSPTFWQTKGITALREFFMKLLDVRPRHKKDYYSVFRWLISKRLAFALVIIAGISGLYYLYIMAPAAGINIESTGSTVRAYRYNSIALKFMSGNVQILAKDNHVAYIGPVKDGTASGSGSLYRSDGSLLYAGEFQNNRYNGTGKLYNPDGTLSYAGAFADNLYNGKGISYRNNGTLEYSGNFLGGLRSGSGTLFNSGGNEIFTGNFQANHLLYSEFVNKKTSEISKMYTGESAVYSSADQYCVQMKDINVVYSVNNGSKSLEADWTVGTVIVQDSEFPVPGKSLATVNQLTACFGKPDYFGATNITLPEAVAINQLGEKSPVGQIKMSTTQSFDNVYSVSDYDKDVELYIYVYKSNGLTYTFYCDKSTSNFFMYSITKS